VPITLTHVILLQICILMPTSVGLQTTQDARFYAISSKFDKPFSNEGKTLVIQFSVKHEQEIDCGGGYVKVFSSDLDQKDMHGDTPYHIMFGPDICGYSTKKVHVIFNYKGKNLLTKKDIRCKVMLIYCSYFCSVSLAAPHSVLCVNKCILIHFSILYVTEPCIAVIVVHLSARFRMS
jgi:Calreticulin family